MVMSIMRVNRQQSLKIMSVLLLLPLSDSIVNCVSSLVGYLFGHQCCGCSQSPGNTECALEAERVKSRVCREQSGEGDV